MWYNLNIMKTNRLFAVAAMLAAGTAFGDIAAVTPTAWNGKRDCWQLRRHDQKMKEIAAGGAKVVFIGDSITHFWEGKGKEQLKKYFSEGDMKMLNLGFSGDRTEHVLWRLDHGELDGYKAKCVLLMIGTNNTGHKSFDKEPPIDTFLGIRKILVKIREKQPDAVVVLTAIFPRGDSERDSRRMRNDVVNAEIMKLCDGKTVFWCDFSDKFLDENGDIQWVMKDRLHPGASGYEIWYKEVKPYIDWALADRKGPAPKNRFSTAKTAFQKEMASKPATIVPTTRIAGLTPKNAKRGDWWANRLLQKRNQIADSKGEIDLVFFGDSITHNWEGAGKKQLAELSKTYSILDIGYGGDRTQHLVWRGLNGELDGYKAKCVMLMIGTNNRESVEDIANGVRRVLEVIAQKQPDAKTLLLPIFPRGEGPANARRIANEKVNAIIKNCADGRRVIWVDFNSKFLDEKGDTKWIMPDRLHPNAAGYKIWTDEVLPYFKSICGK